MNFRQIKRKHWYPISVSIEIALRKVHVKVDRFYRKSWIYLFLLLMLPFVGVVVWRMHYDYSLIHNHANLDAPFASVYTEWRTDGKPGSPPPGGRF